MVRRAGKTATTGRKRGAALWEDSSSVQRRCVMMDIFGDTGTGRTTLALTAPGPIALIHSAEKLDGIVEPFEANGKEIRYHSFGVGFDGSMDPEEIEAVCMPAWEKFKEAMADAWSWARTIVIDTETEAYELVRFAYFGDVSPAEGRVDRNWGPVNGDWRSMFKYRFKAQNEANLIVIGQTKDEYVAKGAAAGGKAKSGRGKRKAKGGGMRERTGRTIRKGQRETPSWCDVRIRTEHDIYENTFSSRILKGWWEGRMVDGTVLEGENSDFETVMELVTGGEYGEWGG